MKNAKRTMGMLILVVAGMRIVPAAGAQDAATPAKNPESISGTLSASCLLKIVTESSVLLLNRRTIEYLFFSPAVYGLAVKGVIGMTAQPLPAGQVVTVEILEEAEMEGPPSERRILVSLKVGLADGHKPVARELMEAMVANFRKALEMAYQSELNRLDAQIRLTEREVHEVDLQLRMMSIQKLMELSDQDLSSETLRSRVTEITSQLQGLQLEKASQEAYRQSLSKCISEIWTEVGQTLRGDTITAELDQIIQRRMAELKNTQVKAEAGLVSPTELAAMEDRLAAARIDLARRREELGRTGSGAGLGQLTAELTTLTLEAERMQAKEKQLTQQLAEMRESLGRSGEYERVKLRLDIARQNLREAESLHNRARQRARMLQAPSISVIGG